jgi:uroporphyrinogen decarboxylase
MTSRERFLTAMSNGVPDRVPVTPDISNYIPAKRTGLPFWDVYFREKVDLWRAYVDAAEYYRLDMWIASCMHVPGVHDDEVEGHEELREVPARDAMTRRTTWRTPHGDLTAEDICFRGEPPTHTERMVKDLKDDWPKLRWLLREPVGLDTDLIAEIRGEMVKRNQAFGLGVGYPGFQHWEGLVEGSIQSLTFAYMDDPGILDEWAALDLARGTKLVELLLETKPDYLGLGGSGTLTLASPELARRYALPAITTWSAMAREAGVPTVLHSCGRSRELIRMLAEETDVSCVNPLEVPPMGDVDLAEVKAAHGSQIALMGNLHTTDVMLRATPEHVYETACDAIRAAGDDGGFILSTGDQCPPGTPDENLFALHRAVEDVGVY